MDSEDDCYECSNCCTEKRKQHKCCLHQLKKVVEARVAKIAEKKRTSEKKEDHQIVPLVGNTTVKGENAASGAHIRQFSDNHYQKIVGLDASDAEKVVLDLIDRQKQFSASAHGNNAAAQLEGGERAQFQRFGDNGGLAQAGGHKAQFRLQNETDTERHALLKADGKYELDSIAEGDLKDPKNTRFKATNDRFDFKLNPDSQTKNEGEGTLSFKDRQNNTQGTYTYTIFQNGKKTDAQLSAHDIGGSELEQSLFGRRSDRYRCSAEMPGVSQCYDALQRAERPRVYFTDQTG
ncbi:unnamed protein product [Bursaphelenchus okinawaensis]|uniref:Uncharacterized protein n=1 Tax=Bursaphelenchus okinawaensis TaxID=465554 RepID=A0A811K1S5_9BILA|nr:unnamed protein product [Bursaphelenchus okinawaensis]CAG9090208.1 unnamed protein product [Bursaphelenchus okinawaensis]